MLASTEPAKTLLLSYHVFLHPGLRLPGSQELSWLTHDYLIP